MTNILPVHTPLTPQQIDVLVENEYLGLPKDFDESRLPNLLMDNAYSSKFDDEFIEILYFMAQPENFYYTCKWLLGIRLVPFQLFILKELWTRKFPMLIGTRGLGKTFILALYSMLRAVFEQGSKIVLVGAAFRQSKLLFEYMEQFWRGSPVLQNMTGEGKRQGPKRDIDRCMFYLGESEVASIPLGDGCLSFDTLVTTSNGFDYIQNPCNSIYGNGKFRVVDEHYDNGEQPTKRITTKKGFKFESTHSHKMKVLRDQHIVWVRADEMVVGDSILIDRSERWHEGDFNCTEDEAYSLGLMIGDGCWTQKYRLGFATEDQELADALIIGTQLPFKQASDKSHWWCEKIDNHLSFINKWGLKDFCYAKDKVLPPTIMSAPREVMTACLQGLFCTDGTLQITTQKGGTAISVSFCNTSEHLVRQIQYILLHYGIVACVSSRDRDEKWNTVYELLMTGQNAVKFGQKIGFRLKRKQSVLQDAIQNKLKTTTMGDLIPGIQDDMVRIAKMSKSRAKTNELQAILDGTKDEYKGKCDPALVPSKIAARKNITMDFAHRFLQKYNHVQDPFIDRLRELCNYDVYYDEVTNIEDGTSHTYDTHVPDGHEYCANGFFSHNTKIRGLRANYTIADEFSCLDKDSIVETKNGFVRISDFDDIDAPLLTGADNVYETPAKFIKTPLCDVYRIRLNNGAIIKCSERHKVLTYDGDWKTPLQLSSGDYIQRSDHKKCEFGNLSIDSRLSWLIGVLMSDDATIKGTHIHITTTHVSVAKKLRRYFGFSVDVVGSHPSKEFCGYYDIYKANLDSEKLTDILRERGVTDVGTNLVKVPSSILKCDKDSLYQFVVGVFEASGIVDLINKDGQENQLLVRCEFGSERLCRDIHFLLYKLGFDGHVSQYYPPSWSCLWSGREAYKLSQFLSLYRFHLTVTQSYVGPEPRGYYYDEDHKKWKVPYYLPGRRTQDRFSDEKDAANHVEYLRSLPKYSRVVSVEKLPYQDHLYDYYLPDSHSFYADGFRQHNSIQQEVFEVVIRGFSAVSASPEKRARDVARIKVLRSLGMHSEAEDVDIGFGNQTVISGTAYYAFNHFCDYWKRYKQIIESRGDKKKLEEIFLGEVPDNFDWTQFSILRVPWQKIPPGFMDETQITQAKATIHRTLYQMEYGACQSPNTLIITDVGTKKIIDVEVGDRVLTHKGRFRKVTKRTYRAYRGPVIRCSFGRNCAEHLFTPEHPFWNGDSFQPLHDTKSICIARTTELSGKTKLAMVDDSHIDLEYSFGVALARYVNGETSWSPSPLTDTIKLACHDSMFVLHDVLFSNKDVVWGFVDHLTKQRLKPFITKNYDLVIQLQLALGALGFRGHIKSSGARYTLSVDEEPSTQQPYFRTTKYKMKTEQYDGYVYNLEVEDDHSYSTPNATVHNCFPRDSDGFFRRSLIESCVCKKPINLPISGPVQFSAALRGNPNSRYIYGIDPASENDNFAIVILEPHEDHRRIVYSWTIKRADLKERIEKGGHTTDKTFYTYCARKIRDLMKAFPPSHIGIDAQGGGIAIMEALHDPNEIEPGEQALWPWIKQGDNDVFWWEKAGKPTDGEPGSHILHMVQFANADFTRDANHFLRKDLETLQILFPMFDSVTLSEALSLDKVNRRTYDTLEDCVMEIEELKDEMATIEHTQTPTGRDKWDTPEVKLPGNKKGRLRKDRYSALLIANMIGHVMENELPGVQHEFIGGYAGQRPGVRSANSKMFVGPEYLVSQMNNGAYGRGVHR